MTFSTLRRLAAASALALAALGPAAHAQALHPLPPDFLATLREIDTSSDEMAAAVAAIRNAELTYSIFSRNRVKEAIASMETQLPALKARTADLRREESLSLLLSTRTAFTDVQRNVGSVSDILHGVTVRTPMQADELDKLLVKLDGAGAHLDASLKRFDSGAMALATTASSRPAQAASGTTPAPDSPAPAQGQAPGAPAAVQARYPLPPAFLATLKEIDTSADELGTSVAAIKKADLVYSIFSRRRVKEAIEGMEKQLPVLKTQTADLRSEESLKMLLTMQATFSDVQRNIGAISDIMHGLTVRTPSQADELDKLLAQLDKAVAHLNTALKQFDGGAMALLDRPAAKPNP